MAWRLVTLTFFLAATGCCIPSYRCPPPGCSAGCGPRNATQGVPYNCHHCPLGSRLLGLHDGPPLPPGEQVPIPKFHPVPTRPVFEPLPTYSPPEPDAVLPSRYTARSATEGAAYSTVSDPQPTPAKLR